MIQHILSDVKYFLIFFHQKGLITFADILEKPMSQKKYRHIFIDLDKTLWDFDANAMEAFLDIFTKHNLNDKGIPGIESFLEVYTQINSMLWGLYRKNEIKKEVLNFKRFELTLEEFGIRDSILSTHIAEDYVTISPKKTRLYPNVREGLDYLEKKYTLHLITNGFEEVQQSKIDNSDLRKYFKTITTSEEAGVKKPEQYIFDLSFSKAGAQATESLMIGDDLEVDILGAKSVGMDQIYFNPEKTVHEDKPTYEMSSWKEITEIL